jgi:flavin-binding protein dodecin
MKSETPGDRTRTQEGTRGRGARAAIDWEAAFAFYVSLAAEERSYAVVAAEFGVSVRTVETHGREEKWKERLLAISKEARARTADSLVEARVAEVVEMRRLINASLVRYEEALRNGMKMSAVDLERLNRLSLALNEEAISPQPLGRDEAAARPERSPEHVRAVIDALAEAGVLETIGLTRLEATGMDPATEKEEGDHELDSA